MDKGSQSYSPNGEEKTRKRGSKEEIAKKSIETASHTSDTTEGKSSTVKLSATEGKRTSKEKTSVSGTYVGTFWIAVGIFMFVYNFLPESSSIKPLFHIWGSLVFGIYLMIIAATRCARRVYFLFGVLLVAMWLGQFVLHITSGNHKIVWPIIMFAFLLL